MDERDLWTLTELLDACEHTVNARTVRFWIREGLLPGPSGGRGVHARYGRRHAARIAEIRRLQALGLSLANIGLLVGDAAPAAPAAPDRAAPDRAGPVPFWLQPPTPHELGVPLAEGVRLLVDRRRFATLDDAARTALQEAAAPLLAVLAGLTPQPETPSTSAGASPFRPVAAPHGGAGDDDPKGPSHGG
ncbi:MAG: MerR family transcriptional regulator [Acidimicrobiia bacterium]